MKPLSGQYYLVLEIRCFQFRVIIHSFVKLILTRLFPAFAFASEQQCQIKIIMSVNFVLQVDTFNFGTSVPFSVTTWIIAFSLPFQLLLYDPIIHFPSPLFNLLLLVLT